MHHEMLAKIYEIGFPKNMDLVGETQIYKVFAMFLYLFVNYMPSSRIQTKKNKNK
jgi:hypothetical protein